MISKTAKLIVSIVVCVLAGVTGSLFTASSVGTWYSTINKPSFNPPSWIFGPVWTFLYVLMGIALFRIWSLGIEKTGVKNVMVFFGIQLILNALWSFSFFGLKSPITGLINILILLIFIVLTLMKFRKIDKLAGNLLIPYLLWVSFASVLNFEIWRLN